jgi:hypothetical protein
MAMRREQGETPTRDSSLRRPIGMTVGNCHWGRSFAEVFQAEVAELDFYARLAAEPSG